ncbi:hypothetical protein [Gulosibacter bifidus]|uniref:Polysaccharide biosynthesis protein n=1 Tax=Gulosibacter bifidus TaxID=272239 RepID=A0ABW5RJ78_9MICO|nr:hypothetical protein [Gulosibacter bifidus]
MRWLAIATVFAGLAGYAVVVFATLTLGATNFAAFNVFWSAFFMLSGIVQGIMYETTRGVRDAQPAEANATTDDVPGIVAESAAAEPATDTAVSAVRSKPLAPAMAIGGVTAIVLLATSWVWSPALFASSDPWLSVAVLTVAVIGFAFQSVVAGILSGMGRWNWYALLVALEAALRMLAAIVGLLVGANLATFLIITAMGVFATPMLMLATPVRETLTQEIRTNTRTFVRNALSAMVAASATTIMVVGFPVLVKATRLEADPTLLSNLLLAVLLTRAPILVPLQAFQNAIVVYFVDRRDALTRALLTPVVGVVAVGAVGAVLAYFIGPWLFTLMGDGFQISGEVLAILTFASALTGALFVTGAATLAKELHAHYIGGWWVASIIAVLVLLFTADLQTAVLLALLIGPLCGVVWHVAALALTRSKHAH